MANQFSGEISEQGQPESEGNKMIDNEMLYDINDAVMKYCCSLLWESNDSRAMKYLQGSGLTEDTIVHFDLGYSGEDGKGIIAHLKGLGYSDDECQSAGLCNEDGGVVDLFCGRVLFPVKSEDGRVIGFVGRALQGNQPTFTQTGSISPIFESQKSLFGMDHAQQSKADYYILCEGCIDTLMINQAGFDMAINTLRIDHNHPYEELNLDVRRSVLLAFDTDNYGKESCAKAQKAFLAAGHEVGIIDISPYRDPAEFIRMAGTDAFKLKVTHFKSL